MVGTAFCGTTLATFCTVGLSGLGCRTVFGLKWQLRPSVTVKAVIRLTLKNHNQ